MKIAQSSSCKNPPPLCNHDRANVHRGGFGSKWKFSRVFRISRWVMEGNRGGRRGKSDDSIFANVTPRRFNFHTRKRRGERGHGYLRSNPSPMARWLDGSIDWVAIKLNTGAWKWAIVSRPGIRNTRLLNRRGGGQ